MEKNWMPWGDEGKNINRRERGDRRAFSSKRINAEAIVCIFPPLCVLPYLCGLCFLSPFRNRVLCLAGSSACANKRMNKEEAEIAELLF
jgi:hypothetical protein